MAFSLEFGDLGFAISGGISSIGLSCCIVHPSSFICVNACCRLVLASASPQRQQILAKAGYVFEALDPGEAEDAVAAASTPEELAAAKARAKAGACGRGASAAVSGRGRCRRYHRGPGRRNHRQAPGPQRRRAHPHPSFRHAPPRDFRPVPVAGSEDRAAGARRAGDRPHNLSYPSSAWPPPGCGCGG